jgi:DNA repair protein SbcC/Rad50
MRPLELTLTAFRSYASQTIDFRKHSLVVISGDTGAGKTSILDGICFALYGRTPEQSGSRDLLTLGAAHGEVRLTFSTAAGVWRVTRRLGKGAPEPTHLLEGLDGDGGQVTDQVTGATAVSARLVDLVGMGFQAFTSAVLLAQGRFAQFLQATPRDRDVILRELFGIASLEEARAAALAARDAAAREAEVLERERAILPVHTAAARTAQNRLTRSAAARLAGIQGLRPLVDAAILERARTGEASDSASRIEAALEELPTSEERRALVALFADAQRDVHGARMLAQEAAESMDAAVQARDRLRERHGGTASELAALRGLAERATIARDSIPREEEAVRAQESKLTHDRSRLERLQAEITASRHHCEALASLAEVLKELLAARGSAAAAAEAVAAAEQRRNEAGEVARRMTDEAGVADAALDELRTAHLAATMRANIAAGEPCPVCGQLVHTVPHDRPADLHDVEEGVIRLRDRARAAADALTEAELDVRTAIHGLGIRREEVANAERSVIARGGDITADADEAARLATEATRIAAEAAAPELEAQSLQAGVEQAAGTLAEIHRRLDRDRQELAELKERLGRFGKSTGPVTELDAAVRELEMMEQAVSASATYATQAAAKLSDAEGVMTAIERGPVAQLRQSLTLLAGRLGMDPLPADLPADDLPPRANELVGRAQRAASDAGRRAETSRIATQEINAAIGVRGAVFGIQFADDFLPRYNAAQDALRIAQGQLSDIERHARDGHRLARASSSAATEAQMFAEVATDLQANRFPRYLLARFHERLALGASARLQALSHGGFSFVGEDPDPLAVVDHRRGRRVRSAGTLSGGERFLASLSLALALSDIASGSAGRLDCLFLDEGFSSLDGESLEVAIAAVERMADHGRLVAVITHLPGVAERLGAAIHVRKDPAGTSHVTDRAELVV